MVDRILFCFISAMFHDILSVATANVSHTSI